MLWLMSAEEFPKAVSVSDASQISMPGNVLATAINSTLFASAMMIFAL